MKKLKSALCIALCFLCFGAILTGCDLFGGNKNQPIERSIEIHTSFKTEYYVGEQLNVSGGILSYKNENGQTSLVAITTDMISGFDSSQLGPKQMILTYNELQLLVDYNVINAPTLPKADTYYITTTFNDNRIILIYVSSEASVGLTYIYSSDTQTIRQNAIDSVSTHVKFYTKSVANGKNIYTYTESGMECDSPYSETHTIFNITENGFDYTIDIMSSEGNGTLSYTFTKTTVNDILAYEFN